MDDGLTDIRDKFSRMTIAAQSFRLSYDLRVYEVARVNLVDFSERLVDENERDENGKAFFGKASDVTYEEAEVEHDYNDEENHDPETDPET